VFASLLEVSETWYTGHEYSTPIYNVTSDARDALFHHAGTIGIRDLYKDLMELIISDERLISVQQKTTNTNCYRSRDFQHAKKISTSHSLLIMFKKAKTLTTSILSLYLTLSNFMPYRGKPSKACERCRKRRIRVPRLLSNATLEN